eukprot:scaffold55569_cov46-Cyclotella_meneghiniana.AAC.1
MIRAYDTLVKRLQRAGIKPKTHVLDNEISENMKEHIRDKFWVGGDRSLDQVLSKGPDGANRFDRGLVGGL